MRTPPPRNLESLALRPAAPDPGRPLYPQAYAFVVQFRYPITGAEVAGRAEHMSSGRALRFESAGELMSFVQETLMDDALEADSPPR